LVYGNPLGRVGAQTTGASEPSTFQNILGAAATAGGLYKNLGGQQGISNLYNSASNWLNNSPSATYNSAVDYANTSPSGWLDF
jgi:hypothetical protein